MSNTILIYRGTKRSETDKTQLQCYATVDSELCISVMNVNGREQHISLDEPTAIRLSKEIRREIAKIKQNKEVR